MANVQLADRIAARGADIKSSYEAQANTNAFTDAEKTKLASAQVEPSEGAFADGDKSKLDALAAFDSAQTIYVSSSGNDSNDGLSPDLPKLTIGGAITAASALTPASDNIIVVRGDEATEFSEDITVPRYVVVDMPNAHLLGGVTSTNPDGGVRFHRITKSTSGNAVLLNSATAGQFWVDVDRIDIDGTANGLACSQAAALIADVRSIINGGTNHAVVGLTSAPGHIHAEIEDIYLSSTGFGVGLAVGGSIHVHCKHILNLGAGAGTAINADAGSIFLNCNHIDVTNAWDIETGATVYLDCDLVEESGSSANDGTLVDWKAKLAAIEAGADVTDTANVNAAGAVMESDYNANTVLAATADNTPLPVTLNASQLMGRGSTGGPAAITLGTNLSISGTTINASGAGGGATFNWVNAIDDGGCAADGTTNDATAIQTLLTNATAGDVIFFPAGTYGVGTTSWVGLTLSSKSDVIIYGPNAIFKTLVVPTQGVGGQPGTVPFKLNACTRCKVIGLKFDGNQLDSGSIGLEDCVDCAIDATESWNQGQTSGGSQLYAMTAVGCTRCYFDNNIVRDCNTGSGLRGMWLGGTNTGDECNECFVRGNRVLNMNATGIVYTGFGAQITDNISLNNAGSGIIWSGTSTVNERRTVISNNYCELNSFHGIQTDAASTYVSPYHIISNNICYDNDTAGIYMSTGGRIAVFGNLCVSNDEDGITFTAATGATIEDAVIFGNIACENSNRGIRLIYHRSNGVHIIGNVASSNTSDGITLYAHDASVNCTDTRIADNICRENGRDGIYVEYSNASAVLAGCFVTGNTASGNTRAQYELLVSPAPSGGSLTGLEFTDNKGSGSNIGITTHAQYVHAEHSNYWNPRTAYRSAAPTSGTWVLGDVVYNTSPSAGGTVGWVCTTAGTPGTWKAFGTIAA